MRCIYRVVDIKEYYSSFLLTYLLDAFECILYRHFTKQHYFVGGIRYVNII